MDPQLKAQCRQRIYVARRTAVDAAGDPAFGSVTAIWARVEDDQSNTYASKDSGQGIELQTRKRVMTEEQILVTDRVWLPGTSTTDAGAGRTPLEVKELPDETGAIDHYETIV